MTISSVLLFKNPWESDPHGTSSGKDGNEHRQQTGKQTPNAGPSFEAFFGEKLSRFINMQNGGGGGVSNNSGNGKDSGFMTKILRVIIIFFALSWLSTGFFTINTDEQGLISRFGKYNRTVNPGLNYKFPDPIEELVKVSVTRLHKVVIGNVNDASSASQDSREEQGIRSNKRSLNSDNTEEMRSNRTFVSSMLRRDSSDKGRSTFLRTAENERTSQSNDYQATSDESESHILTGDENIMEVSYFVQWRIADPKKYIFDIDDRDNTIVANTSRSVISTVLGGMNLYDALSEKRHKIESEALNLLQQMLDNYNSGIKIVNLGILRSYVAPKVRDAYRDLQSAKADRISLINKALEYRNSILPRARGEAFAISEKAQGYALEKIASAEGEARKFLSILDEVSASKEVAMNALYFSTLSSTLQGVKKVIVDYNVSGGNAISILPFDKLFGDKFESKARSSDASAATVPQVDDLQKKE